MWLADMHYAGLGAYDRATLFLGLVFLPVPLQKRKLAEE